MEEYAATGQPLARQQSLKIYDCTLRDGAQAEGISYSMADKLAILTKLDDLGVHYVEGGWPNPTNPKDVEFFRRARDVDLKQAKLAAFGSTRRPHTRAADDPILKTLIETQAPVVTIFGKSWLLHVTQALRIGEDENLAMIEESVRYLKDHDLEVIYDAEHFFDGYADNRAYALKTLAAASRGGADVIALCDTNGGSLPSFISGAIEDIAQNITTPLGIHAHDDSGLGVANTIAAVECGATQVQGTINGYGERCGNANLTSIIPTLAIKLDLKPIDADHLQKLKDTSVFVAETANMTHDRRAPYVGASAFAHKGGVHIDAMLKDSSTYEHCAPQRVGNRRRYLLSEQSGGSAIADRVGHLIRGVDKRDPRVQDLLHRLKHLEHEGYVFEAAEASVEVLARKALGEFKEPFELVGFRTTNRETAKGSEVDAIVKIRVDEALYHTVAEGDGPVNALDRALRLALLPVYPILGTVRLQDYKVRVLSSREGTAARVRVLIQSSDGERTWTTIGVSSNIIEASWLALVDSLTYKLLPPRASAECSD